MYTPDMNDGKNVFVFGSNLAGRHGKGAALDAAKYWGATRDVRFGVSGNSYAIPTKGHKLEVLSLGEIEWRVRVFLTHARSCPQKTFLVTAIGCGLAGYTPEEIAPLFADAPPNCTLPARFLDVLSLDWYDRFRAEQEGRGSDNV